MIQVRALLPYIRVLLGILTDAPDRLLLVGEVKVTRVEVVCGSRCAVIRSHATLLLNHTELPDGSQSIHRCSWAEVVLVLGHWKFEAVVHRFGRGFPLYTGGGVGSDFGAVVGMYGVTYGGFRTTMLVTH